MLRHIFACYTALVRWPRPNGLTLLSAALLVLLPALAVLQYRWVGQVSVAERERMQRNLRNAAIQFRDTFDVEVGRAFGALQVGVNTARDGVSEPYSDRYEAWVDTAEYPQIVSNVFVIDAPEDALRARQWDARRHAFIDVDWPDVTGSVAPRVRATARGLRPDASSAGARSPLSPTTRSLLVAPLRNFGPATPASPVHRPPRSSASRSCSSNRQYIVDDVLPGAVAALLHPLGRRQLPRGGGEDRSARDGPLSVGSRDAGPPRLGRRHGVVLRTARARRSSGAAADRAVETAAVEDFARRPGRSDKGPVGHGETRKARRPNLGRWLLVVQHASGSLEAAVASVRRRNLGISFGVLLLLSVSVALLAQASRRAQRLARQQMEFVAGVSHELRTPVAVIRSAAENLSQGVVGRQRPREAVRARDRRRGTAPRRDGRERAAVRRASNRGGAGSARAAGSRRSDRSRPSTPRASARTARPKCERGDPAGSAAGRRRRRRARSAVQNLIANAVKYGGDDAWVGVRAEHVSRGAQAGGAASRSSDHGAGIPARRSAAHLRAVLPRGRTP